MAGVKGKSGRRPDGEINVLREWMDEALSKARWIKMLDRVAKRVEEDGDARAFLALAQYRFGLPSLPIGGAPDLPPIVISCIVAVRPPKTLTEAASASGPKKPGRGR